MQIFVNSPNIYFSCPNKTNNLKYFWFKNIMNDNSIVFFWIGQCLPLVNAIILVLKDFDFLCSPSINWFPTNIGGHPFNIIQWFPWNQESELAMVMFINSRWLFHPFRNIYCRVLFLSSFSFMFFFICFFFCCLLLTFYHLCVCVFIIILCIVSEPSFS